MTTFALWVVGAAIVAVAIEYVLYKSEKRRAKRREREMGL